MEVRNKRSLYVGGLDRQVTEETLYAAFVPFGPLKSVQIPLDHASKIPKGFGFVEFESEEDALEALDNMDDSELFGRVLRVSIAKPDRPKLGSRKPVWATVDDTKEEITEPMDSTIGSSNDQKS